MLYLMHDSESKMLVRNESHCIPACAGMTFEELSAHKAVIPAQAGIQLLLSCTS